MQKPEQYHAQFKDRNSGGQLRLVITYDADYMTFDEMIEETEHYVKHHLRKDVITPENELKVTDSRRYSQILHMLINATNELTHPHITVLEYIKNMNETAEHLFKFENDNPDQELKKINVAPIPDSRFYDMNFEYGER